MKNKLVSIGIIFIFLFTSLICVDAIAPTPRIDLNDYEITTNNINNVYISGTCSICVGQLVGVYDSSGKIIYNYAQVGNSNSKESFKFQIPDRFLKEGKNTFKVKSLPVKNVINGSNSKTITVTINSSTSKKDQTIKASNLTLKVNEKKNINASVSSNLPLTYVSQNPSIATVEANGLVIAHKVGTTKVVISQAGNSQYKPINKTVTITVKSGISECTITYNSNGGKGNMANQSVVTGSNVKISKNKFTRDGYTFTGWATSKKGKVVYLENRVIKLTKDMTLYAVWMKKPPARVKPGKHKCYVIEVDLTNQICTVYDCYTNGTRNPIMSEWVSTGKKGRGKTPVGTWKIGKNSKGKAKHRTARMSSGKAYAEFFVRFKSAKGFHTVPCGTRQTHGKVSKGEFNKLGTPRSAGCVRCPYKLAKFIYYKCPSGTKVKVFKGTKGYYPMGKPKKYKATSNYDPTR